MKYQLEIRLIGIIMLSSVLIVSNNEDTDQKSSSANRKILDAAIRVARCRATNKNFRVDCDLEGHADAKVTNYDSFLSKSQDSRNFSYESTSRTTDSLEIDTLILGRGISIDEPADFNASLHCKDTDVIRLQHNPGIWIIEQSFKKNSSNSSEPDGTEIQIQTNDGASVTSFVNLSAGSYYRYRARRVTSEGLVTQPETTPWFKTFEIGHRSEKVERIELENQASDETYPSRVQAGIVFQPGSDRGCRYQIVSFTEDQGLTIGNLDSSQGFRFNLHDIGYETNVTVFVSSFNMGDSRNSNNVSLTFVTPSCLELHRNLTLCAPDSVTGFHVTEILEDSSNYNVFLKWDRPLFLPDIYTLKMQSADYSGNVESSSVSTSVVPGNSTEAVLAIRSKTDERGRYDDERLISIVAESLGGVSPQTWIKVNLDRRMESSSSADAIAATVTKGDGRDVRVIVVPSVAIIVSLLLLVAWFARLRIRDPIVGKRHDDRYKYSKEINLKLEFEKKDPLLAPMIDKFELRPTQLTIKDILGSGSSGIVRLGSFWEAGNKNKPIDVAVKMLRDDPNEDDLKNFQQEIAIMKSTGRHKNIVSIIGCCTFEATRPMLVVEYCSRGDLQTYLRTIWQEMMSRDLERGIRCKMVTGNDAAEIGIEQIAVTNQLYDIQEEYALRETEDGLTVTDLLSFARQVACGMEFLSSNRVIHRDLAARNVLLCADKTAKISDFGLSRDIYQENVYKKQGNSRLPLKWMAIEALTHQIYTTQSDVWSFGILLWEIVTLGCNPYPETPTNMMLELLKSGYRMGKPDNCGQELYEMMLSCWRTRPQHRPNFTSLKYQLDGMLRTASSNEYLNVDDLIRETSNSNFHQGHRSIESLRKKDYLNVYST